VKKNRYPFPLAVQIVLPLDYRENALFKSELDLLQALGFEGVELNIAYPEKENITRIRRFLDQFELRPTMYATGLTAKTHGLSLSSADNAVWQKSLEASLTMIDFVAGTDTGIIVGFLKGGPSSDVQGPYERFAAALNQIAPHAERKQVRVVVEATNRYESAVANDLEATVDLVKPLGTDYVQILPDTFHMNIEEAQGPIAALKAWSGFYQSVHLSDNNRFFPGFGAIDFNSILSSLKEIGYQGSMAIEGNIRNSFKEDIQASAEYLVQLPLV
jgi:D-psicose/D-tagatose/L-ribulose 3-epimerase